MARIGILGAGGFGTSLAVTFAKYGHEVTLWSAYPSEIEEIYSHSENRRYLPGIHVHSHIHLTTELNTIVKCEYIIMAVPSFAVREVAQKVSAYIPTNAIVINVAKGFEDRSLKRLSEVILEEIPNNTFVALSGPSHAEEIARGMDTAIVAASQNAQSAAKVQAVLSNEHLRIYGNADVKGVEIGGALKNVLALCAGISNGLGLGDNTVAALMTRGLAEISRLGVAMGAKMETLYGLTGLGDLIVTCASMHSRNRRAGILIGQGISPKQAIKQIGSVVEGYSAAKIAYGLSQKYNVSMPISEKLYQVLYEGANAKECIRELMVRPSKDETPCFS